MKDFVPVLKKTKLFSGVGDEEISTMLSCLGASLFTYKKGEFVLRQGEHLSNILVLVEGSLHIQRDDYWGNRSILGHIGIGEIFGEAYAAPDSGTLLNDVIAVEDSAVYFFDVKRVISTCSSACRFHTMVVQNLFFAISEKNRTLVQKLDYLSRRTTREKLISYLDDKTIEIAPLAFMRGRTLDNAYVILDEAQNATESQIKMFLTRMGRNAKFFITGDITQIDLPKHQKSGLIHVGKVLKDIKGIDFIYMDNGDVVRHQLVTKIIQRFEQWEEAKQQEKQEKQELDN